MLPSDWIDFVFPTALRHDRGWINQFGKTRRTYLFGFGHANIHMGRFDVEDFLAKLTPLFKEDPRRVVPYEGWRDRFKHTGEVRSKVDLYAVPPREPRHEKCTRWGAYGKDQPEHAWLLRPMRLYDALKSVAALFDARAADELDFNLTYSTDGLSRRPGELALHVAIFNLSGFDLDYYNEYLSSNTERLRRLHDHCGLWRTFNGTKIPTFLEMAEGLSATYRTCEAFQQFAAKEGLPDLGEILPDLSSRGTNRHHRQGIKKETRKLILQSYSADCAVEIFSSKLYTGPAEIV